MNKKERIIEYIFLTGIIAYVSYYFLYLSYIWHIVTKPEQQIYLKMLFYIGIICLLIKIAFTKYVWKEIFVIIVVFIIMLICWKHSGGIDYPVNCLIIFSMKNMDLRKTLKTVFFTALTAICYGLTWTFLNAPETIAIVRDFGRGMVESRYRFCISNPNALQLLALGVMLCFLYVYYKRCKWWLFAILMFFYIQLFQLTRSRTCFICGVIAIMAFFVLRYYENIFHSKIILILFEAFNIMLMFGMMYLVFYANKASLVYTKVNEWTTNRLSVAERCVQEGGIHLFGSNIGGKVCGYGIYTQPVPGYVTELGVVRTFLEYGHIVFGLFVAAIVLALWIMHRRKNYAAMIALSVALCAFSFEAYFPAAYNMKAFILGYAFFELTKCSNINKKRIRNG